MRRAVLLDRDGVLNARRLELVRKPSQVRILPGVPEAVASFSRAGLGVSIVTNQQWVSKGWIKPDDHEAIMRVVVDALEGAGARIDGAYAALVDEEAKPRPDLLLRAARDHGYDLGGSFMVGDNVKDLVAGRAAGTRTVLVDPRLRTWFQGARRWADHVAPDLPAAAGWVLGQI